jgi:prevent-host-death family protein
MERIIDVTTARRQFGTLLDEVFYRRDVITVERKGKPLVRIIPFEETDSLLSSEQKVMLEELHSLPTISTDQNPTTLLRKMRKQKRIYAKTNYGK